MNKLWIFGDSFSDPNYVFNNDKTWYHLLQDSTGYEVKNYSKAGVGLNYCIRKYKNFYSDFDNDYLIFLLPDYSRLDLNYLPNSNMAANSLLLYRDEIDVNTLSNKFFKENLIEIKKDYSSFYKLNLDKHILFLYLSYILLTAKYFKRCFFIGCNDDYYEQEVFQFIENNICDNSYFYPKSILRISSEEFVNNNIMFLNDNRNNHLTSDNHFILNDIITNFLFFNEKLVKEFKTKNVENRN